VSCSAGVGYFDFRSRCAGKKGVAAAGTKSGVTEWDSVAGVSTCGVSATGDWLSRRESATGSRKTESLIRVAALQ